MLSSQLLVGASFDCGKAATEVEKTICADPMLSKLDTFLALAYKQALTKSSDRKKRKASQYHWLVSKRNACNDDAICLHREYFLRILELTDVAKKNVLSGSYERYDQDRPSFHSSDIDILELTDHQIYINGMALWYLNKENEAKGIVHMGEVNGIFPLAENRVKYQDTYGCSFLITFQKNGFVVSESKNTDGCWGANVTFDGKYIKKGAKP